MPSVPRMRTLPKALDEIKRIDPNTCLSMRLLRLMVENNEIPSVLVANKRLINLDLLLEKMSCYNNDSTICTPDGEQ